MRWQRLGTGYYEAAGTEHTYNVDRYPGYWRLTRTPITDPTGDCEDFGGYPTLRDAKALAELTEETR